MGKILGLLGTTMVYFCVASMISLALLLVFAKSKGFLAPERVAKMLAVARGENISAPMAKASTEQQAAPPKPLTYGEREQQRQVLERNLELREQALRNERETVAKLRLDLELEVAQFKNAKEEYTKNLQDSLSKAQSAGRDTIRQLWETLKPKQTKELMLTMIEKGEMEEVAAILRDMPIAKQAKIVAEFRDESEQVKLDDLLRLLRIPPEANVSNRNPTDQSNPTTNR